MNFSSWNEPFWQEKPPHAVRTVKVVFSIMWENEWNGYVTLHTVQIWTHNTVFTANNTWAQPNILECQYTTRGKISGLFNLNERTNANTKYKCDWHYFWNSINSFYLSCLGKSCKDFDSTPAVLSSRMESISNQPTPQDSGATTPDNHSTVDTLSEQDEGTMTPPSKQTTPATSPHNSFR